MAIVRLEKFLANAGAGTRSQIKGILKQGRVTVDGVVEKDGSRRADFETLEVCLDGVRLRYEEFVYYLLNKPEGCVSATKDALSETVITLLKDVNTKGLFPVGRLDKDTEGLLLITNDGKLAHELLSPKKHVAKKYYVNLDRPLVENDRAAIETGIDIGDEKPCLPAVVEIVGSNAVQAAGSEGSDGTAVYITITEGRYHQVKRMFAACGYTVTYLKRISMGKLTLPDDLLPGSFIRISKTDII